ncbi:MAG: hypothetical protein ACOYI5_11665 [Christensenellales bacterium]
MAKNNSKRKSKKARAEVNPKLHTQPDGEPSDPEAQDKARSGAKAKPLIQ